jgi:hypothetical protein
VVGFVIAFFAVQVVSMFESESMGSELSYRGTEFKVRGWARGQEFGSSESSKGCASSTHRF